MTPDVVLLRQDRTPDLAAGEFSEWLAGMDRAIRGETDSDVPCGDCNACCRSSYFIALKPSDTDARARIPATLLFDAPGAPSGHQVLGYDGDGHCPMLEAAGCTIYPGRPATCRTYDCRVFAATGIAEPGPEKSDVNARAARWRFDYADEESRARRRLLRLGARKLVALLDDRDAALPRTATQLAMLAVRLYPVFEALGDDLDQPEGSSPDTVNERIRAAVEALYAANDS
jgi:Fe-S-cluster containining protein